MCIMKINYACIGSFPEVATLNIEVAVAVYHTTKLGAEFKAEVKQSIEDFALHFYGLDIEDYGTVSGLVEAMQSFDQKIEVS